MPAAWLPVLDGRIRRARDDAGRGPAGDARLPNPADKRRRRLHLAEHLGQLLLPLYYDETGPTGGAPSVTALREAPDDVVGNEARDESPFADSALHLLRRLRLVRVEVAIDGGAADTEPIGDLLDGVLTLAVRPLHLIQRAGHLDSVGVQSRGPAADTAASARGGEPFKGALHDELTQELIERAEHVELQTPGRGRGVDALLDHQQVDFAPSQVGGQIQQVAQGAGRPGQAGDDEGVTRSQVVQGFVQLGPAVELAGCLVDEDTVTSGGCQRVALAVGILVASADPAVADLAHMGSVSQTVAWCSNETLISGVAFENGRPGEPRKRQDRLTASR